MSTSYASANGTGMGMRQCDLAFAPAIVSRDAQGRSAASARGGLLAAGRAARKVQLLAALLPEFRIARRLPELGAATLSGVVDWSGPTQRQTIARRAAGQGVPFILVEQGLLRAPVGWGAAPTVLSATARIMTGPNSSADILNPERILGTVGWESPELVARASRCRVEIVANRLGGPWWNSETHPALRGDSRYIVISLGGAAQPEAAGVYRAMFDAALAEAGPQRVLVLAPGHESGGVRAAFLRRASERGCTLLAGAVGVWEVLAHAECVYNAGDETGFLALLAGVKSRCFADSYYSGWGITADEPEVRQKPYRRTVEELFAGACLAATRYIDPYRRQPAPFEHVLAILREWKAIEAANRNIAVCLGMSFWKRRQIRYFLKSGLGTPVFRRTTRAALATARQRGAGVAVWASRMPAGLPEAAKNQGIPIIRVEDGFVRSVGLGSDFMPPASLVLDRRGMHFDPSARSDLERILHDTGFDSALIDRARRLIGQLTARGITKYNVGAAEIAIEWPADRRRILVPGQVEDDLSVRLGGSGIERNADLLARVRTANPDAFILYKPHPDVEAGHRTGKIPDEIALGYADVVVRDVSTAVLLGEIDDVHTLTSLAGFEALLRGKHVVVFGRPFYAGWGLTTDIAGIDRGRRLTIEELVAGALILYPRYLDPLTRLPCGPELVVDRLADPAMWQPGPLVLARRLQGALARRWSRSPIGAGRRTARPASLSRS